MSNSTKQSAASPHNHHHHRPKSVFRIEFEYFWFRFFRALLRLLPLKLAYPLARTLGTIGYYFAEKRRTRTIQHLMHAGLARDRKSAAKLARQVARQFAMFGVEIFKKDQCFDLGKVTLTGDAETIRRCFGHDGRPGEQNFILITAHYGSWELSGGAIAALAGRHLVSLMRKFSNPKIGEEILRIRRSPEHELVDKQGGIRTVLRALRGGKNIAILPDQHASHRDGVEGTFFGQPCRTHSSPALLHLKTGVPILPEVARRLPGDDCRFEIDVAPLIVYRPTGDTAHDVAVLTQRCNDALEKLIRKDPTQWLWAHRRWLNINREQKNPQISPKAIEICGKTDYITASAQLQTTPGKGRPVPEAVK